MQRAKFCPKCGKENEKFYDNLCKNCFLQKIKTTDLPENVVVRHCKICKKFYNGGEKGELTLEDAVGSILSKLFESMKMESATYKISGNKLHSEAVMEANGLKKYIPIDFNLVVKWIVCKFCAQKLSGYFNAILQIRGENNLEKILKEIETVANVLNKRDNLAFVSKIVKIKNGLDVYVGSKFAARKIANFLKTKYKVKIKISSKQYGFQDGKQVFRDTILILLSD